MRVGRVARMFVWLVVIVLPVALSGQGIGKAVGARPDSRLSIVQLVEDPVTAYNGGIPGYAATKPARGQKIDPYDSKVIAYAAYLTSRHDAVLSQVGGGRKAYSYVFAFNGFAAELTDNQVAALKATRGVVAVTKDELVDMDTSNTPTFLGLDAPGGLWDQLGGTGLAGDGIIIGLVDSGIWPESLSFSDRIGMNGSGTQDGKLDYHQIPGWHGKCTPGEAFNASMCNQKLIGAQWFNAAWGGDKALETARPWEFMSVRDYNGHGTHTSSTAGGNHGVPVDGPAAAFGAINGMAPHARIAMYKALWSTQDASTASGYTSDLVAAINQAVADGVDVINYSISGTQTNFLDPVQVAYLYAADAGVFVTCSAGNSGPTTSTVAHPGPWLTTVAAGTHNRSMLATATLGASIYTGASVSTREETAALIDSTAAGLPGADPTKVALCYAAVDNGGTAVLDPAKVAGKIVVCDRGVTARVNKSLAVYEAGGVGMILLNPTNNSLNADFHSVPTVHLQNTYYAAVHAYAAGVNPTATISKAMVDLSTPAPYTASFSSRGPLLAGAGDLLKPDVIAPGQDILAAVAPPGNGGMNFNLYSGTSMSSPHVAGLGALLKQAHPGWTPMMIKSALMTTAYDILDGPNTNPLVIFRQGAGHVKPNNAVDPGLVYNAGLNDWLAFLCGTTTGVAASTCSALKGMGYSLDPSDLNVASIAIGELAGVQTVARTVTNVGGKETYTFSSVGLAGINVTPSVASFTVSAGATQKYTVTFTQASAPLNAYVGGYIKWTGDKGHIVRIPVVLKPVALAAPASVFGTGGALNYNVTFGYTGTFAAAAQGLVAAQTFDGSVNTGASVSFDVTVPAGTTYARFSLFDANVAPASDLDLRVYRGSTLVGSSGGGTSTEEVNLVNPTPATYTVFVDGFATGNPSTFRLFAWVLGSADAGNMAVSAPTTATVGGTGAIGLTFSALSPGTKYLGSVAYSGVAGMPGPTIVRIDP